MTAPDEPQILGQELSSPVLLGGGRSIRPPLGWQSFGFVTDNPLWIMPKSRLRWSPPGTERLSLHWSLTPAPIDDALIRALIAILAQPSDDIALERLEVLSPQLIRIESEAIKKARVVTEGYAGAMLRIDYRFDDDVDAGIVCYSPTEMYEQGEVQILGYEGEEPLFSQYVAIAERSLATFAIGSKPASTGKKILPEVQTASGRYVPLQTYSLKAGETISSVVKSRWPDLDEAGRTAKVREVFTYNRTAGNTIEAWNLKEGTVIFLPPK